MALVPATGTPTAVGAAHDFYRLRREGIGHIEQTGSAEWTDYNSHDPGISILEALAYAITELAYRTGFPIEDILASAVTGATADDPYPGQTFYTARSMLTVNPTTAEDFRRLLIDVDPVRNAWVRCKACACDAPFYAWCEDGDLVLGHDPSIRADPDDVVLSHEPATEAVPVTPRGLYDVLLELEADATLGDLNDRKIVLRRTVTSAAGERHVVTVEVRFPAWELTRRDERRRLADDDQPFQLTVTGPRRTKTDGPAIDDAALRNHWFDVFYADLDIELADHTTIAIEDASVRLFGSGAARRETIVADLVGWLGDASAEGFVEPYRTKLAIADGAVAAARAALETHRNLDEDVCHVDLVEIDDIAVCADVEVEPTADIELVQARIWFEIERYLAPPVEFWSLGELLARGTPVEAIFDGPELHNGFLTEDGLRETELRTELRVSDILNRLVDIDGVVSVDNLQLTAYDAEGTPIAGIADPAWNDGTPIFDPDRISASWLLFLPADHRPRLHRRLSRFLFAANGLPFVPRADEAEDTLVQLHGEAARPKIRAADLDLSTPTGRTRSMENYFPVQHSFPLVYGIGPAGLPSTATPLRRAQALQLKAYLMVFEQLLRNAYAQVAHVGELFALDPDVGQTYFAALFDDTQISRYGDLVGGLTAPKLARLVESPTEFIERRNRFLDHLLARFGESFAEYAMLLTDLEGRQAAGTELVDDKIAFLRALPRISHDRGKAFDRSLAPCDPDNASGLQQRVNLLLGLPDLTFVYRAIRSPVPPGYAHELRLEERGLAVATFTPPPTVAGALEALLSARQLDTSAADWRIDGVHGELVLTTSAAGQTMVEDLLERRRTGPADPLAAQLVAHQRGILAALVLTDRYTVTKSGSRWDVTVADGTGSQIGAIGERFASRRSADEFAGRLAAWSAHKRAVVVEHLLLRPKFPGDALYPACLDGPCGCGCDADPYSFRLTYVMPGWTAPFNTNMNMRGFADRTIQGQTPSHLLVKTCWVGNDGYVPDPCDPMIDALASVLREAGVASPADCDCASEVYDAYGIAFAAWLDAHAMVNGPPDVLADVLAAMFDADVDLSGVGCAAAIDAAARADLQATLVEHFVAIARHGYQFERFEDAWCRWVDADATIDWTAERLQDTVVEILGAGITSAPVSRGALCACAATIIAEFGTHFHEWMESNVAAGTPLDGFGDFDPPPVTLCPGLSFGPGVADAIGELLVQRYVGYVEVSYRLRLLVEVLGELRNTYPRATLHDCDEGSDFNPVRLGQTALGSN